LLGFARWLRRDPLQFAEPAAMEVATALLMLEGALERRPPAPGFSTRAEVAAARLDALQRGETPAAASAPTLDDVRQAQERAALEQVSREMLASLAHVEQALDDFFRNQAKRDPLLRLHQPLQQIIGALSMLGETDALGLVRNAAVSIAGLAREDSRAGQADFERLARELSALGYYIEALPRGGARLEELLEPGRRTPTTAPTLSEQPSAPTPIVPTPPADTPRPSIPPLEPPLEPPSAPEFEPPAETPPPAMAAADATTATAEPFALDFPALDFDLELDSPPPPSLPAEESAAAEARTAEPSTALHAHPADDALTPPLQASASTVDTSGTLGVEALATATVPPDDAAASSAAPAPAPAEAEIDAELLAIFIEEAHEVLGGIATHLDDLRGEADPQVDLVTIRRGFHTLKGSGRMVGLVELGDTAWAVEQALNRWLQLDWPVTPALLALIGEGHRVFSAWVAQLQHGGAGGGDASALVTEARRLHEAGEASHEPGLASVDGHLPQIPEPAQPAAPAPAPGAPVALQIDSADFLLEGELGAPAAALPAAAVAHTAPDIDAELRGDAEVDVEAEMEPLGEIDADTDAEGEEALIEFIEPLEEGEPFALDTLDERTLQALDTMGELDAPDALEAMEPPDLEAPSAELLPRTPPESAAVPGAADSVRIGDGEISRALHDLYCTESAQHLQTLDEALQALQAAPRPPSMVAVRAAHTLAGISGTVRASAPSRLGRALEHALARLSDAGLAPPAATQHTLAETIATLHRMRAEIVAERTPEPADELCARLEAETADVFTSLAGPAEPVEPAAPAEPTGERRAPAPTTAAPLEHAGAAAEAAAEAEVHDDIDTQLLPIFLEEAAETVGELHAILRGWRAEPDAGEAPRAVARQLHSLKGSARMAGAMRLGARLHQLESRLPTPRAYLPSCFYC
ncbi:MAG: Hpt domain-containing protein, partial [Phycisphaerae bacterium]|nr:Hpt domain-containing protein [Phycisphaerae bacterium]